MMSASTLERVSVAYRRGYYDGYYGTNQGAAVKPEYIKPFAEYDYEQGVHAGANDAKWVCPACKKPDWNEPHRERQKEGVPREPTTAIHL
jgi:hypothetical protein